MDVILLLQIMALMLVATICLSMLASSVHRIVMTHAKIRYTALILIAASASEDGPAGQEQARRDAVSLIGQALGEKS